MTLVEFTHPESCEVLRGVEGGIENVNDPDELSTFPRKARQLVRATAEERTDLHEVTR
jgi:hypothetical protein